MVDNISLIFCLNSLSDKNMSNEVDQADEIFQEKEDVDISETSENIEKLPSEVEAVKNEETHQNEVSIEEEAEQSEIELNQQFEQPDSVLDNTQVEEQSIFQVDVIENVPKQIKLKKIKVKPIKNARNSSKQTETLKGLQFYSLPPTIGYENHDITKTRSPMWSFGEFGVGRSARK